MTRPDPFPFPACYYPGRFYPYFHALVDRVRLNPKQNREKQLMELAEAAQKLPKMAEEDFDKTLSNHCRFVYHLSERTAKEYVETAKMMIGYIAPMIPEEGQQRLPTT